MLKSPMYSPLQFLLHSRLALAGHGRIAAFAAGGVVLALSGALWWLRLRRPTAAQLEERRRHRLASTGRIVDGVLIGMAPSEQAPEVLFYTYRIAGVTYECSQDISLLPPAGRLLLDFPVQVRYTPGNPGNSIVVAETWNGLWKYSA